MSMQINNTRLKTTLKMAISKLKFLQEKKAALTKQQRRQLADLLAAGKETSAKIRVENIIRDDIYIELLEFCELYCELLLARISLITDPTRHEVDPGLREAVSSVVYCSHLTEVKEMIQLGELLKHRYGPEFAMAALQNTNGDVPDKIVKRCSVEPPSETLVDLYLLEIARAYEVKYSGLPETEPEPEPEKPEKPEAEQPEEPADKKEQKGSDFDALKARFAALKR